MTDAEIIVNVTDKPEAPGQTPKEGMDAESDGTDKKGLPVQNDSGEGSESVKGGVDGASPLKLNGGANVAVSHTNVSVPKHFSSFWTSSSSTQL